MYKIALKSLLGYKRRLILTLSSIILSVGFVAASFIFSDGIRNTFTGLFDDVFTGIDATVRVASNTDELGVTFESSGGSLPESLLTAVQAIEGVDVAEPSLSSASALIILDKDDEVITTQGPPILGLSWTNEPRLNALRIKDGNGRPPQANGEITIDANTAKNYDFAVGDSIQVEGPEGLESFDLVGIASFGEEDSLAGAIIVAFTVDEAQRMFNLEDRYTEINITAIDGTTPEQLVENINAALSAEYEAVTGEQQSNEQIDDINQGLGFITTFLLVFAGVAVFVGSFIIYNTFRIILSQRSKELALLRAIGASKLQIIKMVLVEALITGIFASMLGVLAGIGLAELLSVGLEAGGLGLPDGPLQIKSRTLIVSLLVGTIVTLLSALLPAIKSSRVSPIEAMRETVDVSRTKPLVRRFIIGGLLSAIGIYAMWLGIFGDPSFNRLYAVGGGVPILFIGVTTLSPLLVRPVVAALSLLINRIAPITGPIAARNTVRSPRRTASTAAALMIGVSLVTLVGIFFSSVKGTIDQVIADSFPADLTFQSKLPQTGPLPERGVSYGFTDELRQLDELSAVSPSYFDFATYVIDGSQSDDFIYAVDPDTINQMISLKPDDGNYDKLVDNTVYINNARLEANDSLMVGGALETIIEDQSVMLEIVGGFEEVFDSDYIISLATYEEYASPSEYTLVYASYASGFSEAEDRPAVDALTETYPSVKVQNAGQLVEDAKMQIDQILALLWGMLGMTLLIAVLGITNTLTLSIIERTKEIGLMRAIGMTKSQVRRTILLESAILAIYGALLGIAMGVFFAWGILKALETEGLTSFVVSLPQLATYVGIALFAGIVAAVLPSRKASNTSVLEAINYE